MSIQKVTLTVVQFDDDLFPPYLPDWADAKLDGEWVQYAQLQTKDGRRMGNAVIISGEEVVWDGRPVALFTILTDFGTKCRLIESELAWLFHPPQWRMKESRVLRRISHMEGYTEGYID